ncbi:MAG TPA: 4Fe-4S binding protein [Streptosporangiaceae bacterium]|nr:4Fe-4S binding protein [Streptosporangiaceae bacterium]
MTVPDAPARTGLTETAGLVSPPPTRDPVPIALRLRQPCRDGADERFGPSDPPRGWDVTRHPRIARLVADRRFQFLLIVPNQVVFWTVIFVGILGTAIPSLNFGAAITWYVWFCLVFVMMVVAGRAWCAMCPFGGFAEWVQRRTFWRRTQKALGLGRKFPEPLARYGFVLPVATFLLLTWIEEFFNIAGPGNPADTSWMVVGIVGSALAFFLVFERRTFCRYICPLTTLIGTVGSMGTAAGFRTRDRDICLTCKTKDCMRGGENGFGCPWYTWPGSADSNLYCGLCSECYKGCPEGNIGLFLQKPLTSVTAPKRRRADVAWGIALLFGLVLYQQFNALGPYASLEGRLDSWLHFPHYPNPVAYLGLIVVFGLVVAGVAWLTATTFAQPGREFGSGGGFQDKTSRFRAYFLPMAYGLIPVVGADYFARQLPKFFQHAPMVIPSVQRMFGSTTTGSPVFTRPILPDPRIIAVQVGVIALGTLGALWATWRITNRELVPVSRGTAGLRMVTLGFVAACGVATAVLYVLMNAAD